MGTTMNDVIVDKPEIEYAIVLTSCARFDLLRRSVESLLRFADVRPRQFIVVEDSGDEKVRDALAGLEYPFEFIIRPPGVVKNAYWGQGHARQAAAIDVGYARVKTPLVFHMQDDWLFFRTGFIRESFMILQKYPKVSTVGLRGRRDLSGYKNFPYEEEDGVMYHIVDPQKCDTSLGIDFNPGLRRMADYRIVAPIAEIGKEQLLGEIFLSLGFYEAALEIPAVVHLGWERRTLGKIRRKTPADFLRYIAMRWRRIWHKRAVRAKFRAYTAKADKS